MRSSSSNSCRHDAVPRDRVLEAARAWVARLREEHPEIVRVGYFGSYATDTYAPGSDFDVLIEVGEARERRRADRAAPYLPDRFPVGIEIFVYTTAEIARAEAEGAAFITTVMKQIIWLE